MDLVKRLRDELWYGNYLDYTRPAAQIRPKRAQQENAWAAINEESSPRTCQPSHPYTIGLFWQLATRR